MIRVLVVEDDRDVREALATVLRDSGYEVTEAKNGADALRSIRLQPADLVLCDVFMPDMDGLETITKLQRDFPGVKIIAISGGTDRIEALNILKTARAFGVDALLRKPIKTADLVAAIELVLGKA